MCGIIGYIGEKQALDIILDGLEKLEYRGYDSAGVAIFDGESINIHKKIGKIENLRKTLISTPVKGTMGIGHTRWATHGGVTDLNAHPHFSQSKKLALIHNGIIENYQDIKASLLAKGVQFTSETDTEVVAHLIEEHYNSLLASNETSRQDEVTLLVEAVRTTLLEIEGAFAFVIMHSDHPQCIIAARLFSPLLIGLGDNENFVASDIPALLKHTNKIAYLDDHQMALIKQDSVEVFDLHGNPKPLQVQTINFSVETAEKGGYPHFLIKEIHESPRVISDVVRGKVTKDNALVPSALGMTSLHSQEITKISIVACGTAYYASLIGKYLFEKWAGITAEVSTASEFRYHDTVITPQTVVIGVSQSGETADTMASMRKAREANPQAVLALTNVVGSSIARLVGKENTILLNAGPEISVASTKAFTAMIVTLGLMALQLGEERKTITAEQRQDILNDLAELPNKIDQLLDSKNHIAKIAMHYVHKPSMYFMGRGINFPTALEGALKLKEISYIHAEGYAAGEMKHGPIAVLSKGFPVVAICTDSPLYSKMVSSIQEALAREASIIAIGNAHDEALEKSSTHIIVVPKTREEWSPVLNNIALQLFAYYTALYKGYSIDNPRSLLKAWPEPDQMTEIPKGLDIDKPRNLAKSVTVE